MQAFLSKVVYLWNSSLKMRNKCKCWATGHRRMEHGLQPARIRYERHSSRSWGASAFLGSYVEFERWHIVEECSGQCNAQTWWRLSENWGDWFLKKLRVAVEQAVDLLDIQRQLAFEDNPKRSFADFLSDTVMNTDEICCWGLVWVRSHRCRTSSG